MAEIYLGLGSNLGNKKMNMKTVVELLAERVGNISALSSIYETEPWGFESENTFLNAVVAMNTSLLPVELLLATQEIEKEIGRIAKSDGVYHDRLIDIDILMYDKLVMHTPALTLPHPFIQDRLFVLEPLNEIAPEVMHPLFNTTIHSLYLFLSGQKRS